MYEQVEAMGRLGWDVTPVYTSNVRDPIRSVSMLKEVDGGGFDLLHAQYGSGCGWMGSFSALPKVITLRGSDWYGLQPQGLAQKMRSAASVWMTQSRLKSYDHRVVVSKRMKDELASRFALGSTVVPSGVDLETFRPMSKAAARASLGLDVDVPVILFSSVSMTNRTKRVALAWDAVSHLQQTWPDAEVLVLNNVRREDVPTYINAADVVLLTSVHEGWPNIIKECLACNVPFVSTDVSDLATIAEKADNCFVADANVVALSEALNRTLSLPSSRHLRNMILPMSKEAAAHALDGIYRSVLA